MRWLLTFWLGILLGGSAGAEPNVTSYARMTAQLQSDAARCPLLRVSSLGKSAGGKKDLWLVRVADPAQNPARNFRLLVLCRQHGDEPASTEAALSMIHRVASGSDPLLRRSLDHVALYMVPMVNPDGAEVNARSNAAGADLNRDWGIFHQPETRAVANAAKLLHPNIVIDAHNWDGNDEYNADCLEVPREMATALGRTGHAVQQDAVRQLADCGYVLHPTAWGPDTDAHLAHRWFARQAILSALVETHFGDSADAGDFQRRQGLYVALIHGLASHYAAAYAVEKPRLDALEGLTNADGNDAKLFSPLPSPTRASRGGRILSAYAWLWALGAFGLALWGGKSRAEMRTCAAAREGKERAVRGSWRLPGRYSVTRKREGTETRVRSGQRNAVSSPPR